MEITGTNTSEVEMCFSLAVQHSLEAEKKMFKTKLLNRNFTTIIFDYYSNAD